VLFNAICESIKAAQTQGISKITEHVQHVLDTYEANLVSSTAADHFVVNVTVMLACDVLMTEILSLGDTRKALALDIVCDSNDSKAVKKTPIGIKANIDKGETFVAPEARLQALLDTRWAGGHYAVAH
jgi:hypothetical protein